MASAFSPAVSHPGVTTEQIDKASRYLSETRDALVDSVSGLSAAQWEFQPAPDRWSIAEIVEHVVVIENIIHGIIGKMSDAPEPPPGWEQAQVDDLVMIEVPKRSRKLQAPEQVSPTHRWNGPEALEQFLGSREKTFLLLSGSMLRGHVMPHPVFGPWDGYQWLIAGACHAARHTEQIREVRADPGFPKTSE